MVYDKKGRVNLSNAYPSSCSSQHQEQPRTTMENFLKDVLSQRKHCRGRIEPKQQKCDTFFLSRKPETCFYCDSLELKKLKIEEYK